MADKPTPQDNNFEVVGGSEAPSNNTEAIHAGLNLGKARTNPHAESPHFVLIPDGTKLEYLARALDPVRRAGTVALNDEDSFLEYWKRQSGRNSYVYGSLTPAQFVAVFNEHSGEDSPGWRDFRATYVLKHSREWTVWTERNRKEFGGNKSFAEWLEDNLPDIVDPDPARMMEIALNFRVKQNVGFANAVQLTNGQIDLTYANIVEGSSEVKAAEGIQKVQIPGSFTIEVPVWEGLNAAKYKVEARFRYRMDHGNGGGSLKLWYELVSPHRVIEQSFKDMLDKIQTAIGSKVLFGTP